jgi:tryptophanyl-tRNA synthetase
MSKSDENDNATVRILDPRDTIIRKFKRAVTDSGSEVRAAEDKPGVTNLMSIYGAFTGKTFEEIEREFEGKGYGDFKLAVGEACADALEPIEKQYNCLMSDRSYMENVLANNSDYAAYLARKMLSKVYRKVGFLAKNK